MPQPQPPGVNSVQVIPEEYCTDGIPWRIVMSPDPNQEDRYLVDSLLTEANDVIAILKNSCNSPTTSDR